MKKLIILVGIVFLSISASAQFSSGLNTIDTLHKYNNHWIRNSAVQAFTNLRLNTLLHGIIDLLDSALNQTSVTIFEGDTIVVLPHGHGNGNGNGNGGQPGGIRYNDTLFIFEVSKDTVWTAILIEAANGLYKVSDSVKLGGPLIEETDINQTGNGITFHDGLFVHGFGDYDAQVTDFTRLESSAFLFRSTVFDGSITSQISNTLAGITLDHSDGNLFIPNLIDSVQTYGLYINPTNNKVTYGIAGGGGSGIAAISAENGLTATSSSNVKWDGSLNQDVDIVQGGWNINYEGGDFVHTRGDGLISSLAASWSAIHSDGAGELSKIFETNVGSGPLVDLLANSVAHPEGSELYVHHTKFEFRNIEGEFYFGKSGAGHLVPAVTPNVVYYDSVTGKISYGAATVGGGGGSLDAITADNGLTANTTSNVQLGGTLNHTTTIQSNTYQLNISGTVDNPSLSVINNHVSAAAILGTGGSAGIGVSGYAGAAGVRGESGAAIGVWGVSTTGRAFQGESNSLVADFRLSGTAINNYAEIAQFSRRSTGTTANGFGVYFSLYLQDNSNIIAEVSRFATKLTTASHATRTSEVEIYNTNLGTTRLTMAISGPGQAKWKQYGVGTFLSASPAYALGVNASGDMVEYIPSSGGGGGGGGTVFMDPTYFNGDGLSSATAYTLDHTVVAFMTDISGLDTRITTLEGSACAELLVANAGPTGEGLVVDYGGNNYRIKRLVAGTGITLTSADSTVTIEASGGGGGGSEVNTLTATLTGTGSLTISSEAMLEYVLVDPTVSLLAFKIGTVSDDDYYFPSTPVTATALAHEFVVQRYIPSSTAIYFSGITSSTVINLIFKPIHR